jgi:hypothetical protein
MSIGHRTECAVPARRRSRDPWTLARVRAQAQRVRARARVACGRARGRALLWSACAAKGVCALEADAMPDDDGEGDELSAWHGLCRTVQERFSSSSLSCGAWRSRSMRRGEYNVVWLWGEGDDGARAREALPPRVHDKHTIVRLTRGDPSRDDYGTLTSRARSEPFARAELRTMLRVAAIGGAPAVRAALLVRATARNGFQCATDGLWGLLVVMDRAMAVSDKLDSTTASICATHAKDVSQQAVHLRALGRALGARLVALAVRLAASGVYHFDVKPANLVLLQDGRMAAIDFDPVTCPAHAELGEVDEADELARTLLVLAMATAHVRRFEKAEVADGWAEAIAEVVGILVRSVRGAEWLMSARARPTARFVEQDGTSSNSLRARFESVAAWYFMQMPVSYGTAFVPETHADARALIHQILQFGLGSHAPSNLDALFGRCR